MSSLVPRAFLALLLSSLLGATAVTLAPPAHADRWTYDDAVGDVSYVTETETSMSVTVAPEQQNGDIVQVSADHGKRKVKIQVRLRTRLTGPFFAGVALRTRGHRFMLGWMRMPGMNSTGLLDLSFKEKDPTVRCPGLKRSLSAERTAMRFVIPRSCLGDPRWFRFGVTLSTFGLYSDVGYDDDGLRTASTLYGPPAMSPKIRR